MKRVYNAENREQQAAFTRERILKEAKELFKNEGFDRVTIGMIAQKSAVSMPTIYAIFKSKRGVLQSIIDEALPKEKFDSLVDQAMRVSCPKKHLQFSAKIARNIYDAEKELMDVLRGASIVSPELKELEKEREERRYDRQEQSIQKLLDCNALATGLTKSKARDILWVMTGRDFYRLFVIERGWTSSDFEAWLGKSLAEILLKSA